MSSRITTFLLWFLMAVLPLQGLAAVVRVSCYPGHAQKNNLTLPGAHHTDGKIAPGHDHAAMMHGASGAATDHLTTPDSQNHSLKHASAFCNSCGDCCIGVFALPAQVAWALPAAGLSADLPALVAFLAGFIPDSLERPPRPFSA